MALYVFGFLSLRERDRVRVTGLPTRPSFVIREHT